MKKNFPNSIVIDILAHLLALCLLFKFYQKQIHEFHLCFSGLHRRQSTQFRILDISIQHCISMHETFNVCIVRLYIQ